GYKQWVGSACGWGFKPVFVEAAVRGTWDKVKKEATERVDVRVTGALATTRVARYSGITRQDCKYDPWSVFNADCNGWLFLDKQESSTGDWGTVEIFFDEFVYHGPYPILRHRIWPVWWVFAPWG